MWNVSSGARRVRAGPRDRELHQTWRRGAVEPCRAASASLSPGCAESSPMKLGRIVGTVVSTRKDPSLDSLKLLIVENLTTDLGREGGYVVAVDSVGAGLGEVILYATGSSARLTAATKDRPVDAVIMGIVDSFDVEGRSVRLA